MNRCRTLLRRPHDRGRGDSNDCVRGRNESDQDRPHHGHGRDAHVRHGLHRGVMVVMMTVTVCILVIFILIINLSPTCGCGCSSKLKHFDREYP